MFSNPITSIFGGLSIVAEIVKHFFPEYASLLDEITKALLGGGLISAADSSKLKAATKAAALNRSAYRAFAALALIVPALCAPALSSAQTVTVDLNKASLAWDWTKGPAPSSGDVERFDVKCGKQSGVYSAVTPISDPLIRSVKISQILNGSGVWYCVVAAVNRYAASGNSNEVSFDAGAVPADPVNLRMQAQ